MNMDIALKIFTLGVKFGNQQTRLGLEIEKMSDERLAEILLKGFQKNEFEIRNHARMLNCDQERAQWYTQNFTAKQAFYFGLISMFAEYEKLPADKKGKKLLTQEDIDRLTQLQFRDCADF